MPSRIVRSLAAQTRHLEKMLCNRSPAAGFPASDGGIPVRGRRVPVARRRSPCYLTQVTHCLTQRSGDRIHPILVRRSLRVRRRRVPVARRRDPCALTQGFLRPTQVTRQLTQRDHDQDHANHRLRQPADEVRQAADDLRHPSDDFAAGSRSFAAGFTPIEQRVDPSGAADPVGRTTRHLISGAGGSHRGDRSVGLLRATATHGTLATRERRTRCLSKVRTFA